MTFGEKLQKLRRGSGLSQEQLAEKLDVTRQAVSKWELGDSLPDAGRILTLSRLFDVSTDYLLKDDWEETQQTAAPALLPEKKKPGKGYLIAASITGGLGALGFLVIAVLSSMIVSFADSAYTDANGMTWYTSGSGYSFTGFVEKYRLGALLWVFGGLLLIGGILFYIWYQKCKPKDEKKEETDW